MCMSMGAFRVRLPALLTYRVAESAHGCGVRAPIRAPRSRRGATGRRSPPGPLLPGGWRCAAEPRDVPAGLRHGQGRPHLGCAVRHPGPAVLVVNAAKPPDVMSGGFAGMVVRRRPTLPQGPPCSTIGAVRLSFRVRDVTGRFPHAMTTETLSGVQRTLSSIVTVPNKFDTLTGGCSQPGNCTVDA